MEKIKQGSCSKLVAILQHNISRKQVWTIKPRNSTFHNKGDCLLLHINQQRRRWTRDSGLARQAMVVHWQGQDGKGVKDVAV